MRLELNNSGVVFDEASHTYKLGDKYLQGITGLLHNQLFPNEFEGIDQETLDLAASYGTFVHKQLQSFDEDYTDDNSVEVQFYKDLCHEYNLIHECSEYNVLDCKNFAFSSNIDKVFRTGNDSFILADIKTYSSSMNAEHLMKTRWQLNLYRLMFLQLNPGAKVEKMIIIHIRNKFKTSGETDQISEIIEVDPIPDEYCEALLEAEYRKEKFIDPYSIPNDIQSMEQEIRKLTQIQNEAKERLDAIKQNILLQMRDRSVKSWKTPTMTITRKLQSERTSIDTKKVQTEHPEIDWSQYMKTSKIAESLLISL